MKGRGVPSTKDLSNLHLCMFISTFFLLLLWPKPDSIKHCLSWKWLKINLFSNFVDSTDQSCSPDSSIGNMTGRLISQFRYISKKIKIKCFFIRGDHISYKTAVNVGPIDVKKKRWIKKDNMTPWFRELKQKITFILASTSVIRYLLYQSF